jgi:RNA polymerase sigma-70 factor, ECF subfamily
LYRYARALCHEPARADDLVQETYKRALDAKKHPQPATVARVRPWAFTILRHIWQNEVRHAKYELPSDSASVEVAERDTVSPESIFWRKLLRSEIVHAIDSLPEVFREVVVLREIEGLSYDEISNVLDCPRGTVMSRLSRARRQLRRVLASVAPSSSEVEP